ncbi:MAG: glycosyltransferase [Hyphomicrobiales bacterium]|nr:glycosyltransferase [Hyphomicrobiales bacterium]
MIREALDSLGRQDGAVGEVLFLDQQNDPALAAHCAGLSTDALVFRAVAVPPSGLSEARNRSLEMAAHDIVLFLDSDAVAGPGWAGALAAALAAEEVGVVGGRVVPRWHRPPLILARSPVVLEQYSLVDLGPDTRSCDKVVGANFGLHRSRLGTEARFDTALGRRPGTLLGGEETDLCRRVRALGLDVRYCGAAGVEHQILPERIRFAWLQRRFYYAGISRALQGGRPRPYHGSRAPLRNLWLIPLLPAYALGLMRGWAGKRADG